MTDRVNVRFDPSTAQTRRAAIVPRPRGVGRARPGGQDR
jgi:hypothetical protein